MIGVRGLWRSLWMAGTLALAGCGESASPPPSAPLRFTGNRLTVAALDDPGILAGVALQRGEWVASREAEITVLEAPLSSLEAASGVDLILFPGRRMGDLVDADFLEPIATEALVPASPDPDEEANSRSEPAIDTFQYSDLIPAFRDQVSKYGSDRMALPLGGSALVLAYRKDALERAENREAAIAAGLTLEPPTTWDQLDALAWFFQGRDWDGDGTPDSGLAAALGSDPEGVADALFLARAAALGQHRDQYSFLFDSDSLRPRIASPPFVEALRGVVRWKALGPPEMEGFDAAAARAAFREGKTVFLIDRAEQAAAWSPGRPVGVVPLPGSRRVFDPLRKTWDESATPNAPGYALRGGGWLVGVRRGLAPGVREAAVDLARYLASPEVVNRLRAEPAFPMLPVRSSQLGRGFPDVASNPDLDPRQWSDAVSRTLLAERVVVDLRIPEANGYLEDLSQERRAAVQGKDAEAALEAVAQAWTRRSQTLGLQRQLWHYRRSLNTLITLPDPPPRGS